MSFNIELGVRGYKLYISKSKVIEVVQDFFPPTEERKGFLVFLVLQISSRHQLLLGDQIHRRFFL